MPKRLTPCKIPWQQMIDLCDDHMIPPGAMVSHWNARGWVRRLAQLAQLQDWFNDPKHANSRGGPISRRDAWYWAGFVHTSCVLGRSGIAEMTRPRARIRTWDQLAGETIMISIPGIPQHHRGWIAARMARLARNEADYPETKLFANWHRLAQWGRKRFGHERFEKIFKHASEVCSGTYAQSLILAYPDSMLNAHPISALTPAFLAVQGEPLFYNAMLLELH